MRHITRSSLIVAALAVACLAPADAPEPTVLNTQVEMLLFGPPKSGGRRVRPWSEAVGERVVAEGLACDIGKGIGQRILLDGAHIYVKGGDLPAGKLVRATGTLQRHVIKAVPQDPNAHAQAFRDDVQYFYVQVEKIEQVDEVRIPWLREVPEPR